MYKVKYDSFDNGSGKWYRAEINCDDTECDKAIGVAKNNLFMHLAKDIDVCKADLYFSQTRIDDSIRLTLLCSFR